MEVVSKEKYTATSSSSTGKAYVKAKNTAPTVNTSAKTITYPKAVVAGSNMYDLKITVPWAINSTQSSEYSSQGNVILWLPAKLSSFSSVKLQVLDQSGNAVNWTGVIAIADLDNGDTAQKGVVRVPTASIKTQIRVGSECQANPHTSGDGAGTTGYNAKAGTTANADSTKWKSHAVYLKAEIPSSGLSIMCKNTGTQRDILCLDCQHAIDTYDKDYDSSKKIGTYTSSGSFDSSSSGWKAA